MMKIKFLCCKLFLTTLVYTCLNIIVVSEDAFDAEDRGCNLVERFKSPFVTGFLSVPVLAVGCVSQELTASGQQVHVMNVEHTDPSQHHARTINLLIKPAADQDVSSFVDVIYVLASDHAIQWRIQTEQFRNMSISIWVSSRSQVTSTQDRHNTIDVKKVDLSSSTRELVAWTRQRWSALTTLTSLSSANSITSVVGLDKTASGVCGNLTTLSNFPAYSVRKQPVTGCLLSASDGVNRIVHIIELDVAGDVVISDVAVNINARLKTTSVKNLVLVLKSHHAIKWHITAHRLRCTLDIITDQTVDSSGVNIEPFRVVAERLNPYSGQDLISWTSEKYGQPTSYTYTRSANQFDIIIDGARPVRADNRLTAHNLRHVIRNSLSMTCSINYLQVAVPKEAIKSFGLSRHNFTLMNASCRATENSTHIILSAEGAACGTTLSTSVDDTTSVIHQNAILVHGISEEVRRHSVTGPLLINFSCAHPSAMAVQQSLLSSQSASSVRGHIKLYRDEHFHDEVSHIPAVVQENKPLFVEVGLETAAPLSVMFAKCYVESGHSALHEQRQIIEGCHVDSSVKWLNAKLNEEEDVLNRDLRFRLDLSQHWSGKNSLMIQCRLAVCNLLADETGDFDALRPCAGSKDYCDGVANVSQQSLPNSAFIINASTGITLLPAPAANNTHLMAAESKSCVADVPVVGHGISSEIVVLIAFAAFAIGVLLMSSLWFIHTRTRRQVEHKRRVLRSAETSGESTPSSTVGRHISTR